MPWFPCTQLGQMLIYAILPPMLRRSDPIDARKLIKRLEQYARTIDKLELLINELAENVGDELLLLRAQLAEGKKKQK